MPILYFLCLRSAKLLKKFSKVGRKSVALTNCGMIILHNISAVAVLSANLFAKELSGVVVTVCIQDAK